MRYPTQTHPALNDVTDTEEIIARDDDEPPVKRRRLEPLLLDSLGIQELRLYIDELKTEIARVEADIGRKNNHRSAADAFFKRP